MRKVRGTQLVSLLVLMMLVFAACGGGDDGGDDGGTGSATEASGECDPGTLEPAEAPAEAGIMKIAQAKPNVTIGTFGDRTGDNANIIIPSHKGMELAIKQANEKGDLPVNLVFKPLDNRNGAADTAPALAQQFIGDPSVVAVLGGGFSGETAATGQLFTDAGLLFFTASATRSDLTELGFDTFFRGLANDNDQGSAIIDVFEKLGCERIAVVDDKTPYGEGLGNVAVEEAENADMEVVLEESIEPTTDYTALVDKQLREKGYEGIIASGDGSKEEPIGEKIGKEEAENVLLTCPCPDINLSEEEDAKAFVETFEAEFNERPGIYAAEGFDVANTTIDAIKECGTSGGAAGVTRACVVEKVGDSDFQGLTKTMTFDDNGQVEAGAVSLFIIKDAVVKEVGKVDDL
jgi:branched-chain amino acid transport system substrate-binding protein